MSESIYGVGAPRFIIGDQTYDFPNPTSRERDDRYLGNIFTNRDGEKIEVFDFGPHGIERYDYAETLYWESLTATEAKNLVIIANTNTQQKVIRYIPHNDTAIISYDILIEKFQRGHPNGIVRYDDVEITVVTRNPLPKLATPDLMTIVSREFTGNDFNFEFNTIGTLHA